jgi:hypothetical protein
MSAPFRPLALSAILGALISASASARDVTLRLLAFDNSVVRDEAYAFDPASGQAPGMPSPIKGFLNRETITITLAGTEILFATANKAEDAARTESIITTAKLPG